MSSDSEGVFANAAKKLKMYNNSYENKIDHCEVLSDSTDTNIINGVRTTCNDLITLSDDSDDILEIPNKKPSLSNDSDTEWYPSTQQTSVRQRSRRSKRISLKNVVVYNPEKVTKYSDSNANNSHLEAVSTNKKQKNNNSTDTNIINGVRTTSNDLITLSDDSDDNLEIPKKKPLLGNDSDTECYPSTQQTSVRQRSRRSKRISLKNVVVYNPEKVTNYSDSNANNSHLEAVSTNKKRKKNTQPSNKVYSMSLLQRLLNYGPNSYENSSDTHISNHLSQLIGLASPDGGISRGLRGQGNRKASKNVSQSIRSAIPDGGSSRGLRGRGKRGRGRKRPQSTSQYPTYSIGNTEEYPDESEDIPLFSSKPNIPNEIVISDEGSNENEELTVHVHWQNFKVFKFNIRKFQKLKEIFDFFAIKENVSEKRLFFAYNDVVLTCDDTPDSMKYNIAKFIEGGLISQDFTNLLKELPTNKPSGIEIKFQCQHFKKPYEISVQPDDKLSLAMLKCAEHFEKPMNNLRFEFDGERISGTTTAKVLELDSGDCIDVRIIK